MIGYYVDYCRQKWHSLAKYTTEFYKGPWTAPKASKTVILFGTLLIICLIWILYGSESATVVLAYYGEAAKNVEPQKVYERVDIFPVARIMLTNIINQDTSATAFTFLFFADKVLPEYPRPNTPSWESYLRHGYNFRIEPVVASYGNATNCTVSLYRLQCATLTPDSNLCQNATNPITRVASQTPKIRHREWMREVVSCHADPLTPKTSGRLLLTYIELALQLQIARVVFHVRKNDPLPKEITDLFGVYEEEKLVSTDQSFDVPSTDPIFGKHATWMEQTANANICYNKYRSASEFIIFPDGLELPVPQIDTPWPNPLAVYLRFETAYRRFTSGFYVPRVIAAVNVSDTQTSVSALKDAELTAIRGPGVLVAVAKEALGVANNVIVPDRHFTGMSLYGIYNVVLNVDIKRLASIELVDSRSAIQTYANQSQIAKLSSGAKVLKNIPFDKMERNFEYFQYKKNFTEIVAKLADGQVSNFDDECEAEQRRIRRYSESKYTYCLEMPVCGNSTTSTANVNVAYIDKGVYVHIVQD